MTRIFVIKRLWIDPMENRNADGYDVIGYVNTEEEAKEFCSKGKTFTQKDCWSLYSPTPEFIYEPLERL